MRPDERPFWANLFTLLTVGFGLLTVAVRLGGKR